MIILNKIIVIQDQANKQYFYTSRCDEGFTPNIKEADEFKTIEEAISKMKEEYYESKFWDKIIEFKIYHDVKFIDDDLLL